MGCLYVFLFLALIGFIAEHWPVAVIISCILLVFSIKSAINEKNNKYHDVNFDIMGGIEFEGFCAKILRDNGYGWVCVTKGSGDHGIDILAKKEGVKYAIQCKCYSKNVGNKAVQEAYSGRGIYDADVAVVMTNRYFTDQARIDARKLGVELWDRGKLEYFIRNART